MRTRSGLLALWPALVVLPLLAAALVFDRAQVERQRENARLHAASVLGLQRARIESYLNERLHFVHALAAFARIHPDVTGADMARMGQSALEGLAGIRAIQFAPGAVVTHVVPLAGNEAAIGHDLLADPARRDAVERAISARTLVLAGPYTLRQGGEGVIGRMPIFVGDGQGGERLWGLAIIVLDMPTLYAETGMAPLVEDVRLSLRGRDGKGESGEHFYGDAEVAESAQSLRTRIGFPSGTWEIAALPPGGWPDGWWGRPALVAATLVVCLAFGGLGLRLDRQAGRLDVKADEALRNERRFRTLFDESMQLTATLATDGTLTGANRVACDLMGAETLVGRPFWQAPCWKDDPDFTRKVEDAVRRAANGETAHFECTHRRSGGAGDIEVDFSIKPLTDQRGNVVELLAEGRDVTQRKRAQKATEESEELYRRMFQSNAAVKLLIDPETGAVVDANDAAVAYYGYSREALLGMRISDINTLPEDDIRKEMAAATREQRNWFRFPHRLASGEIRRVEVFSGPVEVAGRRLLHSIIHDVTDRDRFEAELARSNAELEQFAYVASHDLRQPLRQVASYVGLLERRYDKLLDDDGRQFLAYAREGATRMDRLILDLLDYSRVGRSEQQAEPVELADIIAEAKDHLAVAITEAEASVEISLPGDLPGVDGVRSELVRLMMNLVNNALKYRATDRPPRVHIAAGRSEGGIEVSVTDNGIGIDAQDLDRVFMIFQRLHATSAEGTGIGLAVCRKIVERHGGRIWVESVPGEGSSFRFTLPQNQHRSRPSSSAGASTGKSPNSGSV